MIFARIRAPGFRPASQYDLSASEERQRRAPQGLLRKDQPTPSLHTRKQCAGLPGSQTHSQRSWKITATRWRCTSCSTTAHQNTHLSMLLTRRDFDDWDAIRGVILGSVALVRR